MYIINLVNRESSTTIRSIGPFSTLEEAEQYREAMTSLIEGYLEDEGHNPSRLYTALDICALSAAAYDSAIMAEYVWEGVYGGEY